MSATDMKTNRRYVKPLVKNCVFNLERSSSGKHEAKTQAPSAKAALIAHAASPSNTVHSNSVSTFSFVYSRKDASEHARELMSPWKDNSWFKHELFLIPICAD
jgi:hypothetical protein